MNHFVIGLLVSISSLGAALLGFALGAKLPAHHRDASTKDTVKVAMGLIATMTALVLGLLVASAKGSFDTQKSEVTTLAAKIAFLDRVLAIYGPETAAVRQSVRLAAENMMDRLWPRTAAQSAQTSPAAVSSEAAYLAIQELVPQNEGQHALKAQALGIAYDVGQLRWLLFEQADSSISMPMLIAVICWLAVLFFSFALFAPLNATTLVTLAVTALSVAGAIFLIMELDHPFNSLVRISNHPMINAMSHLESSGSEKPG